MELGLINSLGPGLITGAADEDPSTIDLSTIDRLAANPVNDISNTKKIEAIINDGKFVDREKILLNR